MLRSLSPCLAALLLVLLPLAGCLDDAADAPPPPEAEADLPLLFEEDFSAFDPAAWDATDADAWRVDTVNGNPALSLFQQSEFEPPVRSPINRILIPDLVVGDFTLEARVQSTTEDYNHRDLCLFYGVQDDAHLYYTHLGKAADPHAHSIFLVDNEPRVSIADERTEGTPWTDAWHTVRIERRVAPGTITVYFDDMETPIMQAVDSTFTWGRIGFGSFDDTGRFDDVRIWGETVESDAR